jgi:glycosyltransferase involved in cell wall biosynthesis
MKIAWHMPTLQSLGCGLSRRAIEFAKGLLPHHAVRFYVSETKTNITRGRIEGIPVERVTCTSARPLHWSLQAMARRKAAAKCVASVPDDCDVFISCQPEAVSARRQSFPHQVVVYVCGGTTLLHDEAELARQACGSTSRRLAYLLDRRLKRANEQRAFESATAVVFDSHHTREGVIREYRIDPAKCHTICGGVDPDLFTPADAAARAAARAAMNIGADEFVVAWTGRLSPEKNVELLIDAVAQADPRPDRVLLIGDGPLRLALESRIARNRLEDIVQLPGAQSDVHPILHAADAFVFPSRGESFGGALAEAMACGLPCIAVRPDGGAVRNASLEILDDGRCGLLVGNDPRELSQAIRRLHDDADLRKRLGTLARHRAVERFTWQGAGVELAGLLDAVRCNPHASPATPAHLAASAHAQKMPKLCDPLARPMEVVGRTPR